RRVVIPGREAKRSEPGIHWAAMCASEARAKRARPGMTVFTNELWYQAARMRPHPDDEHREAMRLEDRALKWKLRESPVPNQTESDTR
ncbi:MAG: hypothetical protein ACREC2_07240, partial [Bradyrhizobium sp.]